MKTIVCAFGAVFVVCAGVSAEEGRMARLAVANHVANHAGVPLAVGIEEDRRVLFIYDHPDDRVLPLPAGAEVTLVLPPGRYRIVLNDRPTHTAVPMTLQVTSSIEFRTPPPDRPGIHVLILAGREIVYDGPLDKLGEAASAPDERGGAGLPKEEWREHHWKRSEEERQPPAFFSCSIHPWVTSTSGDSCPLCGMGMDREW